MCLRLTDRLIDKLYAWPLSLPPLVPYYHPNRLLLPCLQPTDPCCSACSWPTDPCCFACSQPTLAALPAANWLLLLPPTAKLTPFYLPAVPQTQRKNCWNIWTEATWSRVNRVYIYWWFYAQRKNCQCRNVYIGIYRQRLCGHVSIEFIYISGFIYKERTASVGMYILECMCWNI